MLFGNLETLILAQNERIIWLDNRIGGYMIGYIMVKACCYCENYVTHFYFKTPLNLSKTNAKLKKGKCFKLNTANASSYFQMKFLIRSQSR